MRPEIRRLRAGFNLGLTGEQTAQLLGETEEELAIEAEALRIRDSDAAEEEERRVAEPVSDPLAERLAAAVSEPPAHSLVPSQERPPLRSGSAMSKDFGPVDSLRRALEEKLGVRWRR